MAQWRGQKRGRVDGPVEGDNKEERVYGLVKGAESTGSRNRGEWATGHPHTLGIHGQQGPVSMSGVPTLSGLELQGSALLRE